MKKYLYIFIGLLLAGAISVSANVVNPFRVFEGGTGQTTLPASQLLYGNGTGVVGSAATSTITCAGTASCGAGSYVIGNALTITGSAGSSASSTLLTDSNNFSGVNLFTNASSNFSGTWQTHSPAYFQIAGNYLTSYDAWTHALQGQSATTSLMLFNNATSTLLSSTYASSTNGYFGTLNLPNLSSGCLSVSSGLVSSGSCYTGTLSSVGLSDSNSTLTIGSSPLTSNGTITATLNLGHTNTWSILQNFNYSSTTSYASFTNASSTKLSVGTLTLPNLATAAGSFIAVDGSGNVIATSTPTSSSSVPRYTFATTSPMMTYTGTSQAGFATSSPLNIPAGVMTASSTIDIYGNITCTGDSSGGVVFVFIRSNNGVPFFYGNDPYDENFYCPPSGTSDTTIHFQILANNSTSAQTTTDFSTSVQTSGTFHTMIALKGSQTSTINTANAFSIYFVMENNSTHTSAVLNNMTIIVNP